MGNYPASSSNISEGSSPGSSMRSEPTDAETCECGKSIFDGSSCKFNPKLVGTVKQTYTRHVIICTGKFDWEPKIHKEFGSLASELHLLLNALDEKIRDATLITCCSEKSHSEDLNQNDIIVYPEGIRYLGVGVGDLSSFVNDQIRNGIICSSIKHERLPFERLVLVCTHNSRDKRCGRAGPQILKTLQSLLSNKGIDESRVVVRGSSHLGGHKYAGVVVVYPEGDWYGQMSSRIAETLLDAYCVSSREDSKSNAKQNAQDLMAEHWRGRMGEPAEVSKKRLIEPT